MTRTAAFTLLLLALLCWFPLPTDAQTAGTPPLDISLEFARLPAGATDTDADIVVAVAVTPEQGWYAYANQPGSLGQPTVLDALLAGEGQALAVRYPPGIRKPDPFTPEEVVNLYLGQFRLFVLLPPDAAPSAELSLRLSLLLCSDKSCMPVVLDRTATIPEAGGLPSASDLPWWSEFQSAAGGATEAAEPPQAEVASEATAPASEWSFDPRYYEANLEVTGLWKAVLLALVAGFVLNFMPCVLPVVSLKISSLVSSHARGQAEDVPARRKAFTEHNLYFAMGILAYFLALSLVLSFLELAWGELFQNPTLIMILAAVVFALSLSLFDVYTLPIINLRGSVAESGSPRTSAFMTGILATLLATPCSGPFLGGVLAWALLQPTLVVAMVFMSIGAGMALPYLLMSAWPGLVRFFPKPGAWTVKLERIVGFFLLATCIYLLNILPETLILSALVLLWVTGVGFWIWGAWTNLNQSTRKRWTIRSAALALIVAAAAWAVQPPARSVHWREFSSQEFQGLLGEERILVDFTADWCVSCKFLEQTTLTEKNLAKWQKEHGLVYVRVDLTGQNPEGMALLRALGSQSIPVVAVFPKGQGANRPLVLRDLFTSSTLNNALDRLF